MPRESPDKGGRTEELLREYFLRAGYFAVRGVPLNFDDLEVTDVDVWLYLRPSSLGRERVNVDAKDKGKPKALERVLWAKGLQSTLGLERAVVATTDKRSAVRQFGNKHGVLVLDGHFISRLAAQTGATSESSRLSEEEFVELFVGERDDRFLGNWKKRLNVAKGRLLTQLEFDGCNAWLDDVRYFADQVVVSSRKEAACRLLYLMQSFLLIGLDYSLRTLAFESTDLRRQAIESGFRYGSEGKASSARALSLATRLIEGYAPDARGMVQRIRASVDKDLSGLPVEALGEYFVRAENKDMFADAKAMEALAFARVFVRPAALEVQAQALIGVMLDFFGMDRVKFFGAA